MEEESLTAFSLDGSTKIGRLKILSEVIRATEIAGAHLMHYLEHRTLKTGWGICSKSFAGLDR